MDLHPDPEITFAERIGIARRRLKLSQWQVGALIDRHGMTVQGWESGRSEPVRYSDVVKLAAALEVDVEWLDPGALVRNKCSASTPVRTVVA